MTLGYITWYFSKLEWTHHAFAYFLIQNMKCGVYLRPVPISLSNKNMKGNVYLNPGPQVLVFSSKMWSAVCTYDYSPFIQQKFKAEHILEDCNVVAAAVGVSSRSQVPVFASYLTITIHLVVLQFLSPNNAGTLHSSQGWAAWLFGP